METGGADGVVEELWPGGFYSNLYSKVKSTRCYGHWLDAGNADPDSKVMMVIVIPYDGP